MEPLGAQDLPGAGLNQKCWVCKVRDASLSNSYGMCLECEAIQSPYFNISRQQAEMQQAFYDERTKDTPLQAFRAEVQARGRWWWFLAGFVAGFLGAMVIAKIILDLSR